MLPEYELVLLPETIKKLIIYKSGIQIEKNINL